MSLRTFKEWLASHELSLETQQTSGNVQLDRLITRAYQQKGEENARLDRASLDSIEDDSAELHPLSPYQEGLWGAHKLSPESPAYNVPIAFRLEGKIDIDSLKTAIQKVLECNELLTCRFVEVEGIPYIAIDEEKSIKISSRSCDDQVALDDVSENSREPFDLLVDRPYRVSVYIIGPDAVLVSFVFHHIVVDGPSETVLLKQISNECRNNANAGQNSTATLQYTEYVAIATSNAARKEQEEDLQYWEKYLDHAPTTSRFPIVKAVTDEVSDEVQRTVLDFEAESFAQINELCRLERTSSHAFFISVVSAFLMRINSNTDVVVGTPASYRAHSGFESLVGYFVNLMPVRTNLQPEISFRDLISSVAGSILDGMDHLSCPFTDMVNQLNPERYRGISPFVQTMVTIVDERADVNLFDGLGFKRIPCVTVAAKYDVSIVVVLKETTFSITIEYKKDVFGKAEIYNYAQSLRQFIFSILQTPDAKVAQLCITSSQQKERIFEEFNKIPTNAAKDFRDIRIDSLVAEQAKKTPDAIAVVGSGREMTYRELLSEADKIADFLTARYKTQGALIGVHLKRDPQILYTILGILRAGMTYVPLDPAYPDQYISAIVEGAGLYAILTDDRALGDAAINVKTDVVELSSNGIKASARSSFDGTAIPGLSNVIFTSGSTGKPKGVMVGHDNIAALLDWSNDCFDPAELSNVLFSTSICFDISVFEMWAPLTTGGTVHLVDSILDLCERPYEREITLINTVPSAFDALLQSGMPVKGLSTVIFVGEPLPANLVNRALSDLSASNVWNLYGPTEDTVYSTAACFNSALDEPPSIGQPIKHSFAYILDDNLQLSPPSVPGELCLAGAGVTRGYLFREDLTNENFVNVELNPYFGQQKIYLTGDIAVWNDDGTIRYLGRKDNQIKLRGFRIELSEIEVVIQDMPLVAVAVVDVRGQGSSKMLVAFVEPIASTAESHEEISTEVMKYCQESLPGHMKPSIVKIVGTLPRMPNGKADRRSLGKIYLEDENVDKLMVLPSSPTEIWICELIKKILEKEVSLGSNFYEIGGNSLTAVQIISRVNSHFKIGLKVSALLDAKDLQQFSGIIGDTHRGSYEPLAMVSVPKRTDVPISLSQRGAWHVNGLKGFASYFNMCHAVEISGPLDVDRLRISIGEMLAIHSILATSYRSSEDGVFLSIPSDVNNPLKVVDVSDLSGELAKKSLEEIMTSESHHIFDLMSDIPFRATLVRHSSLNNVLILNIHHIASDGWSINIIKDTLARLYANQKLTRNVMDYATFAYLDHRWQDSERFKRQIESSKKRINSFVVYGHPKFLGESSDVSLPGETAQHKFVAISIAEDVSIALRDFARAERSTMFVLILAAFHRVLFDVTDADSLIISFPIANRFVPEIEQTVGLFVNMVNSFSERPDTNIAFNDFQKIISDDMQEGLSNSEPQLFAHYFDGSITPPDFPAIVLNLNDHPKRKEWQLDGLETRTLKVKRPTFPPLTLLELSLYRKGNELVGELAYDCSKVSSRSANIIKDSLIKTLGSLTFR
jgi:amino acid adenylation domain-containing protein